MSPRCVQLSLPPQECSRPPQLLLESLVIPEGRPCTAASHEPIHTAQGKVHIPPDSLVCPWAMPNCSTPSRRGSAFHRRVPLALLHLTNAGDTTLSQRSAHQQPQPQPPPPSLHLGTCWGYCTLLTETTPAIVTIGNLEQQNITYIPYVIDNGS